jgi:hypothetical protein
MRDEKLLYLCKVPFKTSDYWAKTNCIMGDEKPKTSRNLFWHRLLFSITSTDQDQQPSTSNPDISQTSASWDSLSSNNFELNDADEQVLNMLLAESSMDVLLDPSPWPETDNLLEYLNMNPDLTSDWLTILLRLSVSHLRLTLYIRSNHFFNGIKVLWQFLICLRHWGVGTRSKSIAADSVCLITVWYLYIDL